MLEKPDQSKPKKRPLNPGLRLTIIGFLIIWGASIAFALQLKTLLTPGRYTAASDPSLDILIAVIFFFLFLIGILFLWGGFREIQGLTAGKFNQYISIAAAINVGLLFLVLVTAGLVFSANRAFASQAAPPLVRDEPTPVDSVQGFPTPDLPQPTPTFDPGSVYLAGNIIDYFTQQRMGTIWISASKANDTIYYIEVFTNRNECHVQQDNSVTIFAVDKSMVLINGPIQNQHGNFFAAQDMAVIQGFMDTTASAYGTLYLHFIDPTTNRSCDLGSFTWSANATGP